MAGDPGATPATTPSERPSNSDGSGTAGSSAAAGTTNQRRKQGGKRGQRDQQGVKTTKFEGRCDELAGHVYDYAGVRQAADQYTKTTREICEYVGRTYKHGADTKIALETLAMPAFREPEDPPANATRTRVRIWEKEVDEYVKRGILLTENLKTAYLLIYGQCSEAMRAKLESRPNHQAVEASADAIALLENIRTVMFQFQAQRYATLALHEAKRRFYTFTQDKHSTVQQYYETFKNNIDVIEYCGGKIGDDPGLIDAELVRMNCTTASATPAQQQQAQAAARERALACALLFGSDKLRYGKLLEDLENNFVQGTDNYPDTVQRAYTLLVHWKQDPKNVVRLIGGVGDGLSFANLGRQTGTQKEVICYRCKKKGHVIRNCPEGKKMKPEGRTSPMT
jgi:predicted RNA-binding protein associated with RNAse of E/G family